MNKALSYIVKSVVAKAVAKEARMAAPLLRLYFYDCFVKVHFSHMCHFVNVHDKLII